MSVPGRLLWCHVLITSVLLVPLLCGSAGSRLRVCAHRDCPTLLSRALGAAGNACWERISQKNVAFWLSTALVKEVSKGDAKTLEEFFSSYTK